MDRVFLFGVPIDALSTDEVQERLHSFLDIEVGKHVLTPNSEMLVDSVKNKEFRQVLKGSALNIPDSAGLLFMARATRQKLPERVTGVDTVQLLCASLTPEHPVFLLGAGEGVAEKAGEVLKRRNPSLVIVDTFSGSPRLSEEDVICERINKSGAHILLVAYGAPKQDLWIARNIIKLSHVRLAMGVGGTFDFLAGTRKRAPRIMQRIGLEWLWRLILEPSRIGRIFKAVIVFPFFVLRYGRKEP